MASSKVFKIWYQARLLGSDDLWCESSSLEEVKEQSEGYDVLLYRLVVTQHTGDWEPLVEDSPPVVEGEQVYMPIDGESVPISSQQIQCFVPLVHGPHSIEAGEYNNRKYIYECRGRILI